MTNEQYVEMQTRFINGKKWIEKIQAEGTYNRPDNFRHIQFWFELSEQILREDIARGVLDFESQKHSQAYMDMIARESSDDKRKEKLRLQARERAERKRRGESIQSKSTEHQGTNQEEEKRSDSNRIQDGQIPRTLF